jgi:hypothetical protein
MSYTTWYSMAEINQIRDKHTTFTYKDYSWELVNNTDLILKFVYTINPDIVFNPNVTIHNVTQELLTKLGRDKIDNYVFNIGLSEMFSYWKTTAAQKIVIKAGQLSEEQIKFWQKLLLKGMGEFFYQNKIEFAAPDFINISSSSNKTHSVLQGSHEDQIFSSANVTSTTNINPSNARVLIPVGGGKDSSVSLEILKQNFNVGTYTVSAPQSAQQIIKVSKIPKENHVNLTRVLDPKLFELNKNGYLNGHVPISAYLAFLSILTADLFNYTHIAISNERSSNEGNVWYCDQEINHQYSKSYEFESDLCAYVTQHIAKDAPLYFSFLRPLYELQIAQIFSQFTDYHPVFKSCNRGSKQNSWCGECSKCLFAWTIMFPFLGSEKLTEYFGKNLYEDENLWQTTLELIGLSKTKPFDCVGTHEETIAAFFLSIQALKKSDKVNSNQNKKLPVILEKVESELGTNSQLQNGPDGQTDYQTRATKILDGWNNQNSLPKEFTNILKNELEKSKR